MLAPMQIPTPGKINLDCRKLLHCEFQKFGVVALYLEGGQLKQHAVQILVIRQQNTSNVLNDESNLRFA